MTIDELPDLALIPEVAKFLRVSEEFLAREIRNKRLRATKYARSWKVAKADVLTYVEAHMSVVEVKRERS